MDTVKRLPKISGRRVKRRSDAFMQNLSERWFTAKLLMMMLRCGVDFEYWSVALKSFLHMHNVHKCC